MKRPAPVTLTEALDGWTSEWDQRFGVAQPSNVVPITAAVTTKAPTTKECCNRRGGPSCLVVTKTI